MLRFALLIPALAERGHEVNIAFAPSSNWRRSDGADPTGLPPRTVELVEALCARFPSGELWACAEARRVRRLAAGCVDRARACGPRARRESAVRSAGVLRRRTDKRILGRLRDVGEFESVGRRLALKLGRRLSKRTDEKLSRSVLRITRRLEDAIPTSREVDRYVRELAPDIVLATGTFRHVSPEVELLKSARRLGIPSGVFVTSWDNLTNKGSLKFTPERVFVWERGAGSGGSRAASDSARARADDGRARL